MDGSGDLRLINPILMVCVVYRFSGNETIHRFPVLSSDSLTVFRPHFVKMVLFLFWICLRYKHAPKNKILTSKAIFAVIPYSHIKR